jgi:hypothetical protein
LYHACPSTLVILAFTVSNMEFFFRRTPRARDPRLISRHPSLLPFLQTPIQASTPSDS